MIKELIYFNNKKIFIQSHNQNNNKKIKSIHRFQNEIHLITKIQILIKIINKFLKKWLNCKINQNKFKLLRSKKQNKIIKKNKKYYKTAMYNLKLKNQLKIQYKHYKKNSIKYFNIRQI